MSDESNSSGYAVRELLRSIQASETHTDETLRAKAKARARDWMDVLTSIASGAMKLGDRRPHSGTPVWVAPQVLRGGFAKAGYFAAGGSLLPHELARAAELGLSPDKKSRDALHADSLSQEGIQRLASQLAEGTYRIRVAEQMIGLARGLTAVTKFVWPIPDRGLKRRLGRIACPILALYGDDAQKARLERALTDARVEHVVETYDAHHGWVPADTPTHDPVAAERHWETLFTLFEETLNNDGDDS